ncbi:amidohydrolase family protein [Flavobacteriaceae bacterium R38]|nr:amidohydrolase family protein [Flavobacteriaceae bacterium R38]
MKYLKSYISIGVLLLFISCNKKEEGQNFDVLISSVNIVDVVSGKVIENQSVGINGDTIALIESADKSQNHTGATTIDGTNKFIMSGLWDNHVHFRGGEELIKANKDFLKLFIVNGITGVRDAGGDLTPDVLAWKTAINNNNLIGPAIFTSGPKLDGPNPTWAGSIEVENESQIITAIDSLESLNVDFIKIYDSRISRESYLTILKEAKKRGMLTSGHMPFTVNLGEAIENGIGSVEHLYYILKGCSSKEKEITEAVIRGEMGFWDSFEEVMRTYDDEIAKNTFEALKQQNTHVVPTLHIGDVLSYLDENDHTTDEYLSYIDPGIIKTYEGRIRGALNASPEAKIRRKNLQKMFVELVPRLQKAGVKMLAGSDSGAFNSYTYPGISLHKELEEMVKSGLTTQEALKTSTYNGAAFLGHDDHYGTFALGKSSDLIILSGNPLEDITNTRTIEYVILGETVLNKENLNQMLATLKD